MTWKIRCSGEQHPHNIHHLMDGIGLFPDSPEFQMVAFILMDIVLVIRAYVYSISKQIHVKTPVFPVNRCEFKTTKKHLEKKKHDGSKPHAGQTLMSHDKYLNTILLDWFLNGNPYGKITTTTTTTVNQDKPASLASIHPGNGKSLPCTTHPTRHLPRPAACTEPLGALLAHVDAHELPKIGVRIDPHWTCCVFGEAQWLTGKYMASVWLVLTWFIENVGFMLVECNGDIPCSIHYPLHKLD